MDAVSYGLASDNAARLDKLYTESSTAPVNPKPGDEWLYLDEGILYTRVTDGVDEVWVDLGGFGYAQSSLISDNNLDDVTDASIARTNLFAGIGTTDPLVAGQLWSDNGVVKISQG